MPLTRKPNPTALHPNPYQHGDEIWEAYNQCLSLEQHEGWNTFAAQLQKDVSEGIMNDLSPRVAARVLGWALRVAPSDEGRNALVREIVGCNDDPELLAGLAHLSMLPTITASDVPPVYNPKGPTPSVSATQSPRIAFQQAAQDLEHLLPKPSITAQDLRQLLLYRDNHSCVFTGAVDLDSARSDNTLIIDLGVRTDTTRVAHIISQSLSENIAGTTPAVCAKFEWAKTAGAIIERFGGFSSRDILSDNVLNSPLNAFTAATAPHEEYDKLDLWLTAVDDGQGGIIPDTYDVQYYWGERLRSSVGIKQRITFKTATVGNTTIPPPHPRLITLHAACAMIAHMSGAAEHLKECFRDTDMISVMTEPNAAYELTRALKTLQLVSPTV
ncbi:uncharacterized protein B0H18DRAFT_1026718 [Fomitopsis serialis]|uniref:uncharacterized protein n=1 Tax=Fomitopsis serialis TaxID=139415 RepID=UPI002008DBD2|nr:uncharacterized protein B0H18DRAFT_1026718 [Neoantrodia serialis]KAH9919692.1 hypothetical protein B0H18DRAFT_1026718 [Neoantrodia serialis]